MKSLIAFMTGISFMGYEILGSRVMMPYFGSSVYVWGSLLSIFMIGLSIGYKIGGITGAKAISYIPLAYSLFISAALIITGVLIHKPICEYFVKMNIDIKYSSLLCASILFLLPTITMGFTLPFMIGVSKNNKGVSHSVGNLYSISTIGCIIGTILTSFYLIGVFTTQTCIFLITIPLILSAVIVCVLKK